MHANIFDNEFDAPAFDVLEHIGDDELVLAQNVRGTGQMSWYSSNPRATFSPLD